MIGELERMLRIAGGWLISRILRLDLMLLAIVMCLVTVGFITLFSAGYSFPWRIEDQVRNLIVAAGAPDPRHVNGNSARHLRGIEGLARTT